MILNLLKGASYSCYSGILAWGKKPHFYIPGVLISHQTFAKTLISVPVDLWRMHILNFQKDIMEGKWKRRSIDLERPVTSTSLLERKHLFISYGRLTKKILDCSMRSLKMCGILSQWLHLL